MSPARLQRWVVAAIAVTVLGSTAAFAFTQAGPAEPAAGPQVTPIATPPASPPVGSVLAPETYGAVGDGRADDTQALQAALADLKPGDTLALLPGRTYRHSDVLEVTVPDVVVTGPGTLLASDESRSGLQLSADGIHVRNLALTITGTTRRWDAPAQHRLVLGPYARLAATKVDIRGSAAVGVFVFGARDFRLTDVQVSDTRADGIHMTGGATRGSVDRPVIRRSGDDGVAVVSYGNDPATTSSITVRSPVVRGVVRGRGVSVVGGEDVEYRDVDVSGTYAAGIYVATEGAPYFTRPTRRVRVTGGSVARANRGDDIDHGALLVAGTREAPATDVVLADLAVSDTSRRASAQVGLRGPRGRVARVQLERLTVTGGGHLFRAETGRDSWTARGWVVDGRPLDDVEDP